MTKIQRYEMNHKGLPEPDDNGVWVFRKEHDAIVAALKEQVQTLAAENCIQDFIICAVRDLARETDGVIGWHLNGDIATWDEVLPELSHSETPETEAVIRDIGAKAVEEAAEKAPWLYGDQFGRSVESIPKKQLLKWAATLRAAPDAEEA